MIPTNPIDYTKFKTEVYSPDGTFIKEAQTNSGNIFYRPGLTAGQKYVIVFSYDSILLLVADFSCDTLGKVVHLSPAHFIFNNDVSTDLPLAGIDFENKINRRVAYNVPFQMWERKVLENVCGPGKGSKKVVIKSKKVVRFKAGNDLAGKVR